MVIDSPLTLVESDALYFRGNPAGEVAEHSDFESAASFLWGRPTPAGSFVGEHKTVERARHAGDLLGSSARLIDRIHLTAVVAGSLDPLRDLIAPETVFASGADLIGAMVDALPDRSLPAAANSPMARRLWSKLSDAEPTLQELKLLDSILVLCMDHDLAAATMAARVAASARAHPYAGVAAALSAFDSSLHGSASTLAFDLLREARDTHDAQRALARQAAAGRGIPGFGHAIYRRHDPRAVFLFDKMRHQARFTETVRAADTVSAIVAARAPQPANIDLALAAFSLGTNMASDAGQLIFSVSRTVGWLAHIVDEYSQPALRLRPESRYVGLPPSQ